MQTTSLNSRDLSCYLLKPLIVFTIQCVFKYRIVHSQGAANRPDLVLFSNSESWICLYLKCPQILSKENYEYVIAYFLKSDDLPHIFHICRKIPTLIICPLEVVVRASVSEFYKSFVAYSFTSGHMKLTLLIWWQFIYPFSHDALMNQQTDFIFI